MLEDNEALTGNIVDDNLVQKSRCLLLMKDVPFDLGELKILDTYLSRIDSHDPEHRTVVFTKTEYINLMGLTDCRTGTLKKYTKKMLGKVIDVPFFPDEDGNVNKDPEDYEQLVLFEDTKCTINDFGERIITLTCTTKAKNVIFNLENIGYLKYELKNILQLSSRHSYFLYLYLRDNRFRRSWDEDLDILKQRLYLKNQKCYNEFKYFKRDILDKALKEINEKTDIEYSYETIKHCRKIVAIHFMLIKEPDIIEYQSQQVPEIEKQEETHYTYEDPIISNLAIFCDEAFNETQMNELATLIAMNPSIKSKNGDKQLGRGLYLQNVYARLQTEKKKQRIYDDFAYLKSIINDDIRKANKDIDE